MDRRSTSGGAPLGVVLVSGGASGLGNAIAEAVAETGGTPVILDRVAADPRFQQVEVDLSAPRFAEDAVRFVAERHPDLSGVVTAARTEASGPLADVDAEAWDRAIRVNVIGTAAVIRAALPSLERNQGRIVTVASTTGEGAGSGATASRASAFGVVGFTRALQAELAGRVGVTLLVPGGTATHSADVARAVVFALSQPPGFELRELVATVSTEPSWP